MQPSSSSKYQHLTGEHPFTDPGQVILFLIFVSILILDLFVLKFSNKIIGSVSGVITIPLFLFFLLSGSYCIFISHQTIFKSPKKETGIVTKGIFSRVRHPMYLGSMLLFLSFVILSCSVLAFLIWIVICFFYYFVSRYEEKLLINKFGKEYKKYQEKVPMFIPFWK